MKEKILLASLIGVIWLIVFLTGKVITDRYSSVILLVIFIVLYTWLVTLAMVHQKRMESKRPPQPNLDYLPKVSVVISAHDEEVVIEDTVKDLMKLDYPNFELLIMDDRSSDHTPAILTRLGEILGPPFRYHLRPADAVPGKPAVLNEALSLTDGEIICVFDADAYVEPDFLRRIVPFLADENVGAVQARKIIANSNENWLTMCQNYEYSLDAHFQYGRDSVRGAVELRGNGQLVKREALEEVHGWNNNTLTDDLDLSTRLHIEGWDIRFAHKVPVFEEGITEFNSLLKQRRRWTEGTLFRYLQYAGRLIRSPKASIRTRLDMVAYLLEFLLPLWLILDIIQMGWGVLTADPIPSRILSSLLIGPIFCVAISTAIIVAIIRFNRPPLGHTLKWTAITSVYMTMLWFPLVFGIMVKVLWQKERRTRWDKTQHTGAAHRIKPTAPEVTIEH